jgi:purine-binding chemotaxis protein CheW
MTVVATGTPGDGLSEHDAGTGADARQFVTFFVRGETFAVPLSDVQEIIRLPDVVRLPLSPPSLEGLANLRGQVLPILNLRQIFNFEMAIHDDATRVVVLDEGQPVGLIVDRMANVVTVESDRLEKGSSIDTTIDTELLTGMIKDATGASMIMILDAGRLVRQEFQAIGHRLDDAGAAEAAGSRRAGSTDDGTNDEIQLVSFVVAGQEYALPIEHVQEIVQVPETPTHVPNAPDYLLGVMSLRSRLLPLVLLRSLFGLNLTEIDERARVVIVKLGTGASEITVGLVVDSVKEVLRVGRSVVDPMPALLAKDQNLQDITSICRLDGGKRLVSIVAADRVVRNAALDGMLKGDQTGGASEKAEELAMGADSGTDDEEQFVIFRLLNEEYGVSIESVQEIVRVPDELTHVPKTASFIEGIVNLRGTVLPVIDQRRRFGLPECERSDRQRIMVFTIDGLRTGFIVDSVSEVTRIPRVAIGPAPNLSEEQRKLIKRVANLEKQKRMILLLDVAQLLNRRELAELQREAA